MSTIRQKTNRLINYFQPESHLRRIESSRVAWARIDRVRLVLMTVRLKCLYYRTEVFLKLGRWLIYLAMVSFILHFTLSQGNEISITKWSIKVLDKPFQTAEYFLRTLGILEIIVEIYLNVLFYLEKIYENPDIVCISRSCISVLPLWQRTENIAGWSSWVRTDVYDVSPFSTALLHS